MAQWWQTSLPTVIMGPMPDSFGELVHGILNTRIPAGAPFVHEVKPPEYTYEVHSACGARWTVTLTEGDADFAECIACGADAFDLRQIGQAHPLGFTVEG